MSLPRHQEGSFASVGVDLVSLERMRSFLKNHPSRAKGKLLTESEKKRLRGRSLSALSLAKRFAAKEAVIKAKKGGSGQFSFSLIEVDRDLRGAPVIKISKSARRQLGISQSACFELSLAHERDFAIAIVAMTS